MILEQFLQTRSPEAREWILDRKPKGTAEAADLASDYVNNRAPPARHVPTPAGTTAWKEGTTPTLVVKSVGKPMTTSSTRQGAAAASNQGDTRRCFRCNRLGHLSATCPTKKQQAEGGGKDSGSPTPVFCVSGSVDQGSDNLQSVTVGDHVTIGLRDTGASCTLVRPEIVGLEDIIPGKTMAIKGVGGVRPTVPMARVYLDWGVGKGLREIGLSENIPVNVLLGNDLGRLVCRYALEDDSCDSNVLMDNPVQSELLCETLGPSIACRSGEGNPGTVTPEPAMLAWGRKCIEDCDSALCPMPACHESGLRGGAEMSSVLPKWEGRGKSNTSPVSSSCANVISRSGAEEGGTLPTGPSGVNGVEPSQVPSVTVVTRLQAAREAAGEAVNLASNEGENNCAPSPVAEGPYYPQEENPDSQEALSEGTMAPEFFKQESGNEKLIAALHTDPSLEGMRKRTEAPVTDSDSYRVYCDKGLLYQENLPREEQVLWEVCKQLVVPKPFRKELLKLAHETPLAGHLGVCKIRSRLSRNFYWPGMSTAVANFCWSCPVCQRVGKTGDVTRAPLVPLPVVGEPFEWVAVDLVGPLAIASSSGKQFILTVVDYATRYSEAVALSSIRADKVADALIGIFCRVGFPREMLTDQRPQFMSNLMQSLCKKVNVQHFVASPYHPQTIGLCERFNGTLKQMLRTFVVSQGRDWKKYLPHLLFA
uniref:Gypsy retrotransposon integrase-like protein 1 n=1 Tax=Leptobrachium leishanense TaxID=445787 RepID=A0A8C5MKZ9_9ANUR